MTYLLLFFLIPLVVLFAILQIVITFMTRVCFFFSVVIHFAFFPSPFLGFFM